ncbi:MAG: PQQ-like beta-propeller repeat protein [Phycisphaerae bacterium]|jgi:outer membrane protein assembly factor BamB|nr:PQQ-like beta-propeller repeat protein [Phycisphaerae bacterium]
MMKTKHVRFAVIGLVLVCTLAAWAKPLSPGSKSKLIAAGEPGWSQWRGPRRDGVSDETNLLASWPEGGPKVLWTAGGLGKGWSSPVFSKDAIYITGDVGKELHVFALTLDGKPKWKSVNGKAWEKPYGGARASCTYDDGRVFVFNAHARLACLNAEDGKELWAVDTAAKYGVAKRVFGHSESPLIDGDGVIVTPGGTKGLMVRFDKKTGKELWVTKPAPEEAANYCSAILAELGGKRQIITCGSRHAFGVDAKNGKVLWAFRHGIKKSMSAAIPILHDDLMFISNSSREKGFSYCLRIDTAAGKVTKVWDSKFANTHGSVITVGGKIYGSSRRNILGWACLDFVSGKIDYSTEKLLLGSSIYADGRLYCLAQSGRMALMKPTEKGFEITGEFALAKDKKDAWAHPVILGGRLYLRFGGNLHCYSIQKK